MIELLINTVEYRNMTTAAAATDTVYEWQTRINLLYVIIMYRYALKRVCSNREKNIVSNHLFSITSTDAPLSQRGTCAHSPVNAGGATVPCQNRRLRCPPFYDPIYSCSLARPPYHSVFLFLYFMINITILLAFNSSSSDLRTFTITRILCASQDLWRWFNEGRTTLTTLFAQFCLLTPKIPTNRLCTSVRLWNAC